MRKAYQRQMGWFGKFLPVVWQTDALGAGRMTIAEIAAQMDTAQATVLALSALAVVCGLAVLIARFIGSDNISAALVMLSVLLVVFGAIAFRNVCKTAPETTANQYIVEHYGGGQND